MGDKDEKPAMNLEGNEADVEDIEDASVVDGGNDGVDAGRRQIMGGMGDHPGLDHPGLLATQGSAGVLAMLQSRLGKLVGHSSGYIDSLPRSVKRRIKALKKLQFESSKLEAQFYQEVHTLECKYAALYSPFYEKRTQFVLGRVEPTDEECDFPSEGDTEEEELAEDLSKKGTVDNEGGADGKLDDTKGVPEFWLTTFKNVGMIADMIQPYDEAILKHLVDITLKLSKADPMGFTLEFHFEPNEFFSNTLLTKEYEMKCEPDGKDPFAFDGPEIIKCKGCVIDWKRGKNVTVKTIKKKQKHKSRGSIRTVLKHVQNDSFFNFFCPPSIPPPDEAVDSDTEALLNADFEIGHFLKDRVVPRAVLYFTGEALTDFEDDGEEEEEDECDDDKDEDSDPDYKVDKKYKKQTPPPECKQQ